MSYINMYFRRNDGTDIASVGVTVGAPWLPRVGDSITVCQWVPKKGEEWGTEGTEERRPARVTAVEFELYYSDGGHSDVRYVVTVVER